LLSTLVDQVVNAEADVLDLILSDYASGTLTSDLVFARVGEIAGMRRLAKKVQGSIRGEAKLKNFKQGDAPPEGE
jgi:bifunctional ADP-heptose synthase (sugar kinase/adenylyltransferase)